MISTDSLTEDWILAQRTEFKADSIIIEKVIRALMLLEALKLAKLDFIFKGGTSLMLMIQEPRRFSIDIDVIIESFDQDLETKLDEIISKSDFIRWEEKHRKSDSAIEKRHFKLFYKPVTKQSGDLNNILLDVVFEKNPYHQTQQIPVSHFLVKEEGNAVEVTTPTLPAILGDKLTAYGPNTTGVSLSKPKEVMKQIYDIASIFDRLTSLENVKENFIKVAKNELAYKGLDKENFQLIIDDIFQTSYNFCSAGKLNKEIFNTMLSGVTNLSDFIYGAKFRQPQAQIAVAKATYIAKQIERNKTHIDRFDKKNPEMKSWTIENHNYSFLNKLKKHNLEAFHYWYKVFDFS